MLFWALEILLLTSDSRGEISVSAKLLANALVSMPEPAPRLVRTLVVLEEMDEVAMRKMG